MALNDFTSSSLSGDGVNADLVDIDIQPPSSGSVYTVTGQVQKVGSARQSVNGTATLTIPGAGSTFWIVQVDFTAGTVTAKSNASAYPSVDANNIQVFQISLASTANANQQLDQSSGSEFDTW